MKIFDYVVEYHDDFTPEQLLGHLDDDGDLVDYFRGMRPAELREALDRLRKLDPARAAVVEAQLQM